jgi:hypothetical protein
MLILGALKPIALALGSDTSGCGGCGLGGCFGGGGGGGGTRLRCCAADSGGFCKISTTICSFCSSLRSAPPEIKYDIKKNKPKVTAPPEISENRKRIIT